MTQPDRSRRARYRIRFAKQGALRYVSVIDLTRVWERTLRRAGAPLLYSQGFNPRPQLHIAAGLPLGVEGRAEVMDAWLEGDNLPEPPALLERLRRAAPDGLAVGDVRVVDLSAPALQTLTRRAVYVALPGDDASAADLRTRVQRLLAQQTIPRRRRERSYDLRPLILDLEVLPGDPAALRMTLMLSQEQGTGRPDEVLAALGLDPLAARVSRDQIIMDEA